MWYALVLAALALVVLAIALLSAHIACRYLGPHRRSTMHQPPPSLSGRDVAFRSSDGILLRGWLFGDTTEDRAVILAHGYGGNRASHPDVFSLIDILRQCEVSCLIFDFRAHGHSDGRFTTLGISERRDVEGAIRYLIGRGYRRIGLVGWSMGAVACLLASHRFTEVCAVVADSPFSDLRAYLEAHLTSWTGLPRVPFLPLFRICFPLFFRGRRRDIAPREVVGRSRVPILLIHGANDPVIPATESLAIARAASAGNVSLWVTDDSGHASTWKSNPEHYIGTVVGFLEQHL